MLYATNQATRWSFASIDSRSFRSAAASLTLGDVEALRDLRLREIAAEAQPDKLALSWSERHDELADERLVFARRELVFGRRARALLQGRERYRPRRASEGAFGGDGDEVAQQPGVHIHAIRLWMCVLDAVLALGKP